MSRASDRRREKLRAGRRGVYVAPPEITSQIRWHARVVVWTVYAVLGAVVATLVLLAVGYF